MSRVHAIAALVGLIVGMGLACVVDEGPPIEPCESGANNYLDDSGECVCREGYDWCDASDADNLSCCEPGSTGTGTGTG